MLYPPKLPQVTSRPQDPKITVFHCLSSLWEQVVNHHKEHRKIPKFLFPDFLRLLKRIQWQKHGGQQAHCPRLRPDSQQKMVSKENNFRTNKENKILSTCLIKGPRSGLKALAGYSLFRKKQIKKVSLFCGRSALITTSLWMINLNEHFSAAISWIIEVMQSRLRSGQSSPSPPITPDMKRLLIVHDHLCDRTKYNSIYIEFYF